jgi:hypothetical protein
VTNVTATITEAGLSDLREARAVFSSGINASLILFAKMAGRAHPVSRALLAGMLKCLVQGTLGLWRHA